MKRYLTYIVAALLALYLLVSLVWGEAVAHSRLYKGFRVTVVDSARVRYVSADEVSKYLARHISAKESTPLRDIDTEEIEELLSAKEALFKAIPESGIDFREHLHLTPPDTIEKEGIFTATESRTPARRGYRLWYRTHPEWVMVCATPLP